MARSIAQRSIIITGASSGIGAVTARHCAAAGMHLVLNARRVERLNALADELRSAYGVDVRVVAGDCAEGDVIRTMIDEAASQPGGLYAVFANAGYGLDQPVHEMSMDDLRAMFEVNFFAATELLSAAARRLLAHDQPGHLLMCSSCLSRFALPYYGAYSATKAAQSQICSAMRAELKPRNIAVSSVHPIGTRTDFGDTARALSGHSSDSSDAPPSNTPDPLRQSPDRVARAIVRCLRRPRPEVWTSLPMRTLSAVFALSPRTMALLGDRYAARRRKP